MTVKCDYIFCFKSEKNIQNFPSNNNTTIY